MSWIEALGFCHVGESGPFVEGGEQQVAVDDQLIHLAGALREGVGDPLGMSEQLPEGLVPIVEAARQVRHPVQRAAKLREIARMKRDRVLGGFTTYRPLVTFAWRTDKVGFTPWPWPGYYRNFQEIGVRRGGQQ